MEYNSLKESILKTSPIPYLFVKLHETSSDEYSFIIKDCSYTVEEKLNKSKQDILNTDINNLLLFKEKIITKEFMKKEEYTDLYIPAFKYTYKLIANEIQNNEYVIWLTNTENKYQDEESQDIKNEFFTNLSHELRTPLNIIFSSLQILNLKVSNQKNNYKDTDDIIYKYTDIAMQNTYRLLKLVNNLIDSNKITSGYFDYSPQNYDIVFFIESICQSIVEFAKSKDIEVIFDTDIEEKIISFDLDKMERIILNILSNSIKFSEENGKISIYIKEVDDMIEISISDTGIGIPKDKVDYIFDRFKQIDNQCVRKGEGSGIGLYLVKSLVEMHNGDISVDSELGKGTKFTIRIPNMSIEEELWTIMDKNLQDTYVEKIKIEFSDIYA